MNPAPAHTRPVAADLDADGAQSVDLTRVRPYGDALDDGAVMLSFSLPVPFGEEAKEAGRALCRMMGLREPQVYHAHDLGAGFTYLTLYAKCPHTIDFTSLSVPKLAVARLDRKDVDDLWARHFDRRLRVLGACTGDDAHTVGIDAILNIKGYHGDKGLEAYRSFEVFNLGAQVRNDVLLERVRALQADVVLVSQIVTQKDCHRTNLAELIDLAEAEGLRDRVLFVCGGPRLSHPLALELGFDAGFGPGTQPSEVAAWIVQELVARAA